MNTWMVLGFGVLMGMQHATEADHLAAVATFSVRERSWGSGLRHGLAWGLGHSTTLLLIGGGVGLLGWAISPQLAGRFEQVVGAMLIMLGANLAFRLWRDGYHVHAHTHMDQRADQHAGAAKRHAHIHLHADVEATSHDHAHHVPRSMLVGMVHGLAGSAAMALLASQAMPSSAWGLAYIALFGLGSMLGMALLSGTVALSMQALPERLLKWQRVFHAAAAFASMLLGLRLLLAVP